MRKKLLRTSFLICITLLDPLTYEMARAGQSLDGLFEFRTSEGGNFPRRPNLATTERDASERRPTPLVRFIYNPDIIITPERVFVTGAVLCTLAVGACGVASWTVYKTFTVCTGVMLSAYAGTKAAMWGS